MIAINLLTTLIQFSSKKLFLIIIILIIIVSCVNRESYIPVSFN